MRQGAARTITGYNLLIGKKNVQAQKRKLRRAARKVKHGEMPKAKADEMYASWRSHAAKGNSWKMLKYMDEFYESLLANGERSFCNGKT